MFKIRFWPITASPITAISALGSMFCIVKEVNDNTRIPAMRQRFLGESWGRVRDAAQEMRGGRSRAEVSTTASQLQPRIRLQHGFQVRPVHGRSEERRVGKE